MDRQSPRPTNGGDLRFRLRTRCSKQSAFRSAKPGPLLRPSNERSATVHCSVFGRNVRMLIGVKT